jgi:hypothetical protein
MRKRSSLGNEKESGIMKLFNPNPRCAKCGSEKICRSFHRTDSHVSGFDRSHICVIEPIHVEHHHLRCQGCGFDWREGVKCYESIMAQIARMGEKMNRENRAYAATMQRLKDLGLGGKRITLDQPIPGFERFSGTSDSGAAYVFKCPEGFTASLRVPDFYFVNSIRIDGADRIGAFYKVDKKWLTQFAWAKDPTGVPLFAEIRPFEFDTAQDALDAVIQMKRLQGHQ